MSYIKEAYKGYGLGEVTLPCFLREPLPRGTSVEVPNASEWEKRFPGFNTHISHFLVLSTYEI